MGVFRTYDNYISVGNWIGGIFSNYIQLRSIHKNI